MEIWYNPIVANAITQQLKSDRFGMEISFHNILAISLKRLKSDRFGMEMIFILW